VRINGESGHAPGESGRGGCSCSAGGRDGGVCCQLWAVAGLARFMVADPGQRCGASLARAYKSGEATGDLTRCGRIRHQQQVRLYHRWAVTVNVWCEKETSSFYRFCQGIGASWSSVFLVPACIYYPSPRQEVSTVDLYL
jgi:hypothetical protein